MASPYIEREAAIIAYGLQVQDYPTNCLLKSKRIARREGREMFAEACHRELMRRRIMEGKRHAG